MAHILVVDDDIDSVDLLIDILGPAHRTTGTTDPRQALEILNDRPFDLLITDLRMPVHNGFTLIQMARSIRPSLAVVVISAYHSNRDPACQVILEDFSPFAVAKPFTAQSVNAAVNAALGCPEAPRSEDEPLVAPAAAR